MKKHIVFTWAKRLFGSAVAIVAFALTANVAEAATITVTTNLDEFDSTPNGTCSLREAIEAANTNSDFGGCAAAPGDPYGADTIVFDITGPINLTIAPNASNDDNAGGDLDILTDAPSSSAFTLTIIGPVTVNAAAFHSDKKTAPSTSWRQPQATALAGCASST
jgi:CSLREA domain-containing protein